MKWMVWTEAVFTEAGRCRFGWSLWEYTGDFGFAAPVVPGQREWDEQRLHALGFRLHCQHKAKGPALHPVAQLVV
jgi:hypothetical protein